MNVGILTMIITLTGIVFLLICLLIIILGKKIDRPNARQQRIMIAGKFEVTANSIIILTLIAAALIIAPLVLYYWKANFISLDEVNKNYIAKKDLSLDLYIPLFLENGKNADSVNVELRTIKGNDTIVKKEKGYFDGYFDFRSKIEPEVDYTLVFTRKGYPLHKFHYTFNKITSPMTLTRN